MNCKNCKAPILDSYYFCPNCGKKLKEPPFKFSWWRSLLIIIAAILIPPFGIFAAIRYFLAKDWLAKIVGLIAIGLNIVVLAFVFIILYSTINNTINQVNELTNPQGSVENQIQTLQNSGF